jgi:predicted metal-dependent peptidase
MPIGMPKITNEINWLMAARTRLFKCCPYLANAIFSVKVIYKDDMVVPGTNHPTFAVDKYWRMYVNPKCGDMWTLEEQAGALYHEISHLLRDHAERCEEGCYIPPNWNIAGDLEINDSVLPDGMKYPPHVVTPKKFGLPEELLAEEYYALLEKQAEENGSDGGDGEGGQGVPWYTEKGAGRPGEGTCGSAAHGQAQDYEDGIPQTGEGTGVSQAEAGRIRRDVASKIAEASKERGNIPAGWLRWADVQMGEHRVPWQKIFRHAVKRYLATKAGIGDYTYRRTSRRQTCVTDIILPGQHRPLPQIALLIDTSGSMDDETLAAIISETKNVLQATDASRIYVVACDAAVHFADYVSNARGIKLGGGGGTDMRVGIEHVQRLKPSPDVLIVATDGYTPWPETSPHQFKTVVVVTTENVETPDWARRVYMDPHSRGKK